MLKSSAPEVLALRNASREHLLYFPATAGGCVVVIVVVVKPSPGYPGQRVFMFVRSPSYTLFIPENTNWWLIVPTYLPYGV